MDILRDEIVTAKKDHKCYFCKNTINKGERYRYSVQIDQGDFDDFKVHPSCTELVSKLGLYKECKEEGVTDDLFQEVVIDLYRDLNKLLDSDDLPDFNEVLIVVKEKYL